MPDALKLIVAFLLCAQCVSAQTSSTEGGPKATRVKVARGLQSSPLLIEEGRFRLTTQSQTAPNQAPPAHFGILQIVNGAYVAGAVSCLAQFGIPDLLENGAKSAEELAVQTGAQPEAL